MTFDEWYKESTKTNNHGFTTQEFYEAGAASRQVEIDSLNKNIESLHIENERIQREYQVTFDNLRGRQQTIDALQRKLKLIEALRDSQFEQLQVITQQRDSAQVSNIELQKKLAYSENAYKNVKLQFLNAEDDLSALQKRISVYEKHVGFIKNIHESEFNSESDTSWILGNLDGFFECLEIDLKGDKND